MRFSSTRRDEDKNQEKLERYNAAMLMQTTGTHFLPGDIASNFSSSLAVMWTPSAPNLYKSYPSLTCPTTQVLFFIPQFFNSHF